MEFDINAPYIVSVFFLLAFLGAGNVYEARVVRVIDGDTIRVAIAIWLEHEVTTLIRVRGVEWSDWGSVRRVVESLRRTGRQPDWLADAVSMRLVSRG